MLPIFFFVLAGSPNISGDRIGLVLVSVFILLLPASNYFGLREYKSEASSLTNYSITDIVAVLLFTGSLYLGWNISWEYSLMQVLFGALVIIRNRNIGSAEISSNWYFLTIIYGLVFYVLLYIGLNQYSFSILLGLNNLVLAILSTTVVMSIFYLDRLVYLSQLEGEETRYKLNLALMFIVLQILGFSIFFLISSHYEYVIYYILTLIIPVITIGLNNWRFNNINEKHNYRYLKTAIWLLTGVQTLFFIYYFLDSTQVLQAIQGGY